MEQLQKPVSTLQLLWENEASAETTAFLETTVYGQKGDLQYRHKNIRDRNGSSLQPLFLHLRKANRLLGTACFLPRNVKVGKEKSIKGFYVSYLSFPLLAGQKRKSRASKSSKNELRARLNHVLDHELNPSQTPSLLYAYVEQDNAPSQELCASFGFEKIRQFNTYLFSRIRLRKHPQVISIQENEKIEVLENLQQFYQEHHFFEPQFVFRSTYYVFRKEGKIVAGLQASKVEWEIQHVPGLSGWIILHLLPKIPFLSSLIDPRRFTFLAFDGIWTEKGSEETLFDLMQTACADQNTHVGIVWADSQGALAEIFRTHKKFGLLSALKPNVPADVVARFSNVNTEDKKAFFEQPVYLTATDLC